MYKRQTYGLKAESQLTRISVELASKCANAAEAVSKCARDAADGWRTRLGAGRTLSDTALGLSVRDDATDDEMVTVVWRRAEDTEHTLHLWRQHYKDLCATYANSNTGPQHLVLTRIFAMVSRYEALSEDKSANQAAVPRPMLQAMQLLLGVSHE